MKLLITCLIVLAVIGSANVVHSKTLEGYIKEAEDYQKIGDFQQAASTMEAAVKEYPHSSDAYAYLGLFTGMQAGQTQDYGEAFTLVTKSFEALDKAVSLDSLNPLARLHRGIMSMNVPEFLGKLDGGIKDLEFVIGMHEQSPDKVPGDMLVTAYNLIGIGYQKKEDTQKARAAWEKVIELAPGTELAESAEANIKRLQPSEVKQPLPTKGPETPTITSLREKVKKDPDNPTLFVELGKAYMDADSYGEAEKVLKDAIDLDPSNVKAYKLLVEALGGMAGRGYDEKIYEDTDYRTNLAFGIMQVLDKAVGVVPEDVEIRFMRGVIGVQMPFFVGKLEQGIDDLNKIIKSDAPDSIKAEALYWLGFAHQKKATTYWIEVVSKYSGSRASQLAFDDMRPRVKRIDISKYQCPFVVIDFVLGFRDELAPQTAVWIEDKGGKFVKTIYVSGFSGHAKEKQVNLPIWSSSSKFSDVEGVTGASIDLGHHIHTWDLTDSSGSKVKPGEYVVKVEVAYWPSMKYQSVSTDIRLDAKEARKVVEEGNFIPYLEVKYFPK